MSDNRPKPEAAGPVVIESLFQMNVNGEVCIPQSVLDDIWPIDDREPLAFVGKATHLPPTCTGKFVPCEDRFGREYCLKAIFDGKPLPLPLPETPVPASLFLTGTFLLLFIGTAFVGYVRRRWFQ